MLKQYDPQTARQTILKRTPPDEFPVSQRVLDNIAKLFGESLTEEQAVTRMATPRFVSGLSASMQSTSSLLPFRRQPFSLHWTRSRPFSVMRLKKPLRALKYFTVINR